MSILNIPTKVADSELTSAEVNQIVSAINEIEGRTGFERHIDSALTSGSPLVLVAATNTVIPNNQNTVENVEKPLDLTEMYDGTDILGNEGDVLQIQAKMKVKPTNALTNAVEMCVLVNSVEQGTQVFELPYGNGVEHAVVYNYTALIDDEWVTNGARIWINAVDTAEVYDVEFDITRVHKSRGDYGGLQ